MQVNPYRDTAYHLHQKPKNPEEKSDKKPLSEAESKQLEELGARFKNRYDFTSMSAEELKRFTEIMVQVGQLTPKEAESLLEITHAKESAPEERVDVLRRVRGRLEGLIQNGEGAAAGFWKQLLGRLELLQGSASGIDLKA